jgi:hypothetical protein
MGKSAPKQTTQTVTNQTQLSPQQQTLLSLATPIAAQSLSPTYTTPPNFDYVANLNQTQQRGIQSMTGAAGQVEQMFPQLLNAQSWGLDPNKVFQQNTALRDAITAAQRPLIEQYSSSVLPNIRAGAAATGQYGSSRQGVAEGIATRSLFNQLGDTGASLANNAFDTSMETFGRSLALAPQSMQAGGTAGSMYDAAGSKLQLQEQAELDRFVNDWWTTRQLPLQVAQSVAGMAFGMPGTNTSTAVGPGAQQPGIGTRLLGGASMGAGIGSALGAGLGPWGAGIGALLSLF